MSIYTACLLAWNAVSGSVTIKDKRSAEVKVLWVQQCVMKKEMGL